jgi:hypothetical protein
MTQQSNEDMMDELDVASPSAAVVAYRVYTAEQTAHVGRSIDHQLSSPIKPIAADVPSQSIGKTSSARAWAPSASANVL